MLNIVEKQTTLVQFAEDDCPIWGTTISIDDKAD